MSVANACNAITAWTESYGISNDHDLSPFITGALLVALADSPASDAELELIAQMQQCLTGQELTLETLGAELQWIEENGVDGAVDGIVNNITDENEMELLVLMAALVATVERGVNAQEGTMLQKIGQALGYSQLDVQKLLGKAMQAAKGSFLARKKAKRTKRVRWRSVLGGVLVATAWSLPAFAEERNPYAHLLGNAALGRSLRFNNPFRLAEPLGSTPESVSLAAGYLDVGVAAFLGLPWGAQHGLWLHNSFALTGIDQSVFAPTYAYLWRFQRGDALYGRVGPSIVVGPDLNVGAEFAAGGVYMFSGLFGVNAELLGTAYYGAATRQVTATFIPLLSFQAGLVLDWEVLP